MCFIGSTSGRTLEALTQDFLEQPASDGLAGVGEAGGVGSEDDDGLTTAAVLTNLPAVVLGGRLGTWQKNC